MWGVIVHLKGQNENMVMAVMIFLIVALALVAVLRSTDPLQHPEVKALESATKIASFLNSLSLEEAGNVEIEFKTDYRVGVEFKDGEYFAVVMPEGGEAKESRILFYPGDERAELSKSFTKVRKVCVSKTVGSEFAEVVAC